MPNGGEHYELISVCPHCHSGKIRHRRGFHLLARWRCNRVFMSPRDAEIVIPPGREPPVGLWYRDQEMSAKRTHSPRRRYRKGRGHSLRLRATAVVFRGSQVLLVRHRGRRRFSLPGGAPREKESPDMAVARELREETGLLATEVRHVGNIRSRSAWHLAFLVVADGNVSADGKEVDAFMWWDMKQKVPLDWHVEPILTLVPEHIP